MDNVIVNKVAESSLFSLDLEKFYPGNEVVVFDLKDYLFRGLILREKDFRAALLTIDWESYRGKTVALTCSADAIIPMWAYMLVGTYLQPVAEEMLFGTKEQVVDTLFIRNVSRLNGADFIDKRVVVKGCGDIKIPEGVYLEITAKLRPVVKSIMFGEPCSTVPIFKKR